MRDEGVGLVLWHHNFHQGDSVTDALQKQRTNEAFSDSRGDDGVVTEVDVPPQKKIWFLQGTQTRWEHTSPAELSFCLLPPESVAKDEVPAQHTHI